MINGQSDNQSDDHKTDDKAHTGVWRVLTITRLTRKLSQVCGKDSTACVTDTGRLYAWGKSAVGKLGVGPVHGNVVVPKLVEAFSSRVVCQVALGRNHSACLTDDHRFYSWGSNTFGQLGLPDITTYINAPQEINSLRETNIRAVACGGWHTLTCTWLGAVYSCGKGWHGQLGQGDYESLTAQSKTLPYFKKIVQGFGDHRLVQVFGGKEMSAALSEVGRVFTWGQGDQCQLGHDSTNNESEPRMLEALGKVFEFARARTPARARVHTHTQMDSPGPAWTCLSAKKKSDW